MSSFADSAVLLLMGFLDALQHVWHVPRGVPCVSIVCHQFMDGQSKSGGQGGVARAVID